MSELVTTDRRGAGAKATTGRIQRINPSLRVAIAVIFAVAVVALSKLTALLAAVAVAAALAVAARLPAMPTLRRMLAMDAFMLMILIFLPFTVPGAPLFAIGPLVASSEGLHQAARIVLTANAIVLALLALAGTIEPAAFGHALSRLRVPHKLVVLVLFTVRYIGLLHQEYARLRLAMKARAFRAGGNVHTWRSLGWLFGMLLVRSFERSERILEAMKCRGFSGRYHFIDAPSFGPTDGAFAACAGLVLIALFAVEFMT